MTHYEKPPFKYAIGEEVQIWDNDTNKLVIGNITEMGDETFVVQWEDLQDDTEYRKDDIPKSLSIFLSISFSRSI